MPLCHQVIKEVSISIFSTEEQTLSSVYYLSCPGSRLSGYCPASISWSWSRDWPPPGWHGAAVWSRTATPARGFLHRYQTEGRRLPLWLLLPHWHCCLWPGAPVPASQSEQTQKWIWYIIFHVSDVLSYTWRVWNVVGGNLQSSCSASCWELCYCHWSWCPPQWSWGRLQGGRSWDWCSSWSMLFAVVGTALAEGSKNTRSISIITIL